MLNLCEQLSLAPITACHYSEVLLHIMCSDFHVAFFIYINMVSGDLVKFTSCICQTIIPHMFFYYFWIYSGISMFTSDFWYSILSSECRVNAYFVFDLRSLSIYHLYCVVLLLTHNQINVILILLHLGATCYLFSVRHPSCIATHCNF